MDTCQDRMSHSAPRILRRSGSERLEFQVQVISLLPVAHTNTKMKLETRHFREGHTKKVQEQI